MKWTAIILLALLCFPPVVLSDTETIVCTYNTYSDQQGNHKVKDKFELTFILDNNNAKAYIVGNQGSDEVALIPMESGGGVSFIEVTPAGNVMTTAMDKTGASVHSRNTIIDGKIVPTQYYGVCEFKR